MDDDLPGHRSPARFIVLVFVLALPFWILGAIVPTPDWLPIPLPLSALQLVTPLIAALILVFRAGGPDGVVRLVRRLHAPGRTASWAKYALIVVAIPAIYGLGYLLMRVAGQPVPEPDIHIASILFLFILLLVSAVFEEGGWTGYALDPLTDRMGWIRAAIALGFVWALFHLVADLQSGHDLAWIAAHRSSATALRVLLVFAYFVTGRGVLAAVLGHTMDNVSWQLFPNGGSSYDPFFVAPIMIVAAVAVIALGRRLVPGRQTTGANGNRPVPRGA